MKLIFISHEIDGSRVPCFYLKPDTTLLRNNQPFFYPDFSRDIRAELSLTLRIGRVGRSIGETFAIRYINAVGIGLDLTAHDLLLRSQQAGLPQDCARSFDFATPVSHTFIPFPSQEIANITACRLQLLHNGQPTTSSDVPRFCYTPEKTIAYVSEFLTLRTGDYIFINTNIITKTLQTNDELCGYLNGNELLRVKIK